LVSLAFSGKLAQADRRESKTAAIGPRRRHGFIVAILACREFNDIGVVRTRILNEAFTTGRMVGDIGIQGEFMMPGLDHQFLKGLAG
jgi:hypothetical protein